MTAIFVVHHKAAVPIILFFSQKALLWQKQSFRADGGKRKMGCTIGATPEPFYIPNLTALEKRGYQLCESLYLTPGRKGLTAPAELAASSHPLQSPRTEPGSSSSGRGGCPYHSWRHPRPRACRGHLRPFDNLPHAPSSSYSCPG